jgi:serine/threonine-protein kinase
VTEQTIAKRYELGERLGFGGMSTVQLAFDRRLEREVAVKLLAEHLAEDPQFVSRFRREALAAARLVHPNIVQVFDFGLDETSGGTSSSWSTSAASRAPSCCATRAAWPPTRRCSSSTRPAAASSTPTATASCTATSSPGNILRSDEGQVKLADFGIAKAGDSVSRITQVGSVLGTAAYLSPEQASGEEASSRSDLYSLGVVSYQLLSGRLPYEAQSLTELALKQQREHPPRLDQLDPTIPHGVAQAVERALELAPEVRFATATELREALAAGMRGHIFEDDETAATSYMPEPTSATRVVSATPAQPPQARRLQPTPGAAVPMGRSRRPRHRGARAAAQRRQAGAHHPPGPPAPRRRRGRRLPRARRRQRGRAAARRHLRVDARVGRGDEGARRRKHALSARQGSR